MMIHLSFKTDVPNDGGSPLHHHVPRLRSCAVARGFSSHQQVTEIFNVVVVL